MLKVELVCTDKFWGQRVLLAWGAQQVACCGPIINYIISSMYDCIQSRTSSSAASAAFLVATGSIRRSQRQQQSRVEYAPEHPPTQSAPHTYMHTYVLSCGAYMENHIFCNPHGRPPGKIKIEFRQRWLEMSRSVRPTENLYGCTHSAIPHFMRQLKRSNKFYDINSFQLVRDCAIIPSNIHFTTNSY
jgi:hypothetical protein